MKNSFNIERTLSPKFQNEINVSIVFNYLREKGPISRSKMSRALGLSAPTVSRAINFLEKGGYISEAGQQKTSVGRRPTLLKINNEGYVIGVDLGKRNIKIALANFYGDFISKHIGFETPSNFEVNDEEIIKDLSNLIESIIHKSVYEKLVKPGGLKAICFAVAGAVSIETEKLLDIPLYGNYAKIDFKKVFGDKFKVPIFVENDVNCSAIGEKASIKNKKINDIIFIEISRGVGSGIIIDNKIFRGVHGTSGEIGNSIIDTKNLNFRIKNKGFLEKYASVEGLVKSVIKKITGTKKSKILDIVGGDVDKITAKSIFLAASEGDRIVKNQIKIMVDFISIAILNLILILDPQAVVIGGDICNLPGADYFFLSPIIAKISYLSPFKIPEIRFSLLGEDAGILGASLVATESLIWKEFPYIINF